MKAEFNHYGVPSSVKYDNADYLEGGKVYYTNPDDNPYKIEFLNFDADSPMPKELQTMTHAAFVVESLEEAMEGKKVILEPMDVNENLRCAFIMDGDALIELMQMS